MSGSWRSREFHAAAWRPPAPHTARESGGSTGTVLAIVAAYVISIAAVSGIILAAVLKYGYHW